tara:strand:+ start:1199 stop:1561 length:363 start_codon:yes stop_codon:yes gene_type:complete
MLGCTVRVVVPRGESTVMVGTVGKLRLLVNWIRLGWDMVAGNPRGIDLFKNPDFIEAFRGSPVRPGQAEILETQAWRSVFHSIDKTNSINPQIVNDLLGRTVTRRIQILLGQFWGHCLEP